MCCLSSCSNNGNSTDSPVPEISKNENLTAGGEEDYAATVQEVLMGGQAVARQLVIV